MKTAWSIVSFLAVVHLLALVMFMVWLWQSGRLSPERIQMLRETFAVTVAEADRRAAEVERLTEEERRRAEDDVRREKPPVPSAAQVRHLSQIEEIERRASRRLHDEKRILAEQVAAAVARLEARENAHDAERRRWNETIEREQARRTDEQFAKAVRQYESVPSRQGKNMLMALVIDGRMDQAVAYLDAMNGRAAAKIIQEFRTPEETAMATELLERLRTFGLATDAGRSTEQGSKHADDLADAR
jgi:hypothetical protein